MYTKVAHFVGVVGDYVVGFGLLHKYTIVVWYVSRQGGSTSASLGGDWTLFCSVVLHFVEN